MRAAYGRTPELKTPRITTSRIHPRTCGEHVISHPEHQAELGSSPRMCEDDPLNS